MLTTFHPPQLLGEERREKSTDQSVFLEGITVTASPIDEEENENNETSHRTVIKGKALEGRFSSLPEVLSETVGVKINRFGGLGDFSAISIRGSSSEQVLIYLDGFLLNSAQGRGGDLARVPPSQIESIEVYRGSAPIFFGQSGMGGIVNIRTKEPRREKSIAYQLQYGSFNTSRLSTTFSYKPGKTDYLIGINHEKSENDFEFLNNNGTQFNPADDAVVKRKNSQFESLNLITKVGVGLTKNRKIRFYYNFLKTDKGVPGIGAFQSEQAKFKTEEHRTRLQFVQKHLFRSKLNLNWFLFYETKKEAFRDLLGEIGLGKQDNENKTDGTEFRLNADLLIGHYQTLAALLQFRQERFRPSDQLQTGQFATSRRETTSIGLTDEIALFDDRVVLSPSLLYDVIKDRFQGETFLAPVGGEIQNSDQETYLTRQIGLLLRLSDTLSLRANMGRYFRTPNFFELFGDRGGTIGNTNLLAEEGLNRDIGLRYSKRFEGVIRKLTFQAAHFQNDVENLILFIQTSQKTSKPRNIGKAETSGQEVVADLEIGTHLKLGANYTHQRAVNRSNIPSQKGKILPGRPVHEVSARAEVFSKHLSLFYNFNFTDQNFLDRVNQRVAKSRQIHNIGFSIRSVPAWSITLEAKNLSDDQIEDVFGFPLPGRAYFVTLQGSI